MTCGRWSDRLTYLKMIKGITFDLDGVYFINGKENFIKSITAPGVPEGEAVRVFLKSDQMNREYKEGRIGDQEFWSWAIAEWGIEKTVEDMTELLISGYEINQPVRDFVKKIRAGGCKTLVCSNNFPARVAGLQRRFKFLDDFDAAVFSYEVGATKPSEKIFKELVRRAGLKPGEIVFADDNPENLSGAEKLGITTFLFRDFDSYMCKLRELGVDF